MNNYGLRNQIAQEAQCFGTKDAIRTSTIEQSLNSLEKQIAETGEQWMRCRKKIEPIMSMSPVLPCEEKCPRPEGSVPLANRIDRLQESLRAVCDAIRESTNQIEL